jgi:ligand-binding sensor protein
MEITARGMDLYAILCNIISMAQKKMESINVLLNENVQTALDNFSGCFGARIAYFATDMGELKVGQKKQMCRYCSLIRSKLYGNGRCLDLDRRKLKEASERKTLISYTCHGGLVEAIFPVHIDKILAGFVMVGQFRTASSPPKRIIDDWKSKYKNDSELLPAFLEVPEISTSKLPNMLGLFTMLVRSIANEGISSIQGDVVVEKILHRIRCNLENPPSLSEASTLVSRSKSSVSHIFKAKLGKSFKSCVIDLRLDRAEEILRNNPGTTVKEAAWKVGFNDEFYFSRIFKKYKGFPPSKLI